MKSTLLKICLTLCPLVIYWAFNQHNMPLQFSLVLGMMVMPYVAELEQERGGFQYAIAAALAGLALLFVRSNSLYYFSAIFLVLFIIEQYWGRLNRLPLLLAIVVSPVIGIVVYIWSFPIRLRLSEWAGKILQMVNMDIQVNGNVLILDGNTFSVDPACIGLNMVITSLVLGIVILAFFEKKYQNTLSFWKIIAFLGSILFFAIISNFIRLLTLIIFHILPKNPLHDVVGMVSLSVYVLLPFYFLVKFIFDKKNALISSEKQNGILVKNNIDENMLLGGRYKLMIISGLCLLLVFNGRQFLYEPIDNIAAVNDIHLDGFQKEITPNGVLKLQNEAALIYIKAPVRFYQGSHDPRFCWQGSGYIFSEVQQEKIANKTVYTASIGKGEDKLYTAWWYENSATTTLDEWDWRWQTLRGADGFYMLNVSCADRAVLRKMVTTMDDKTVVH